MTKPVSLDCFAVNPSLVPGEETREYVLVRVRAAERPSGPRPRLEAVLVLDTSGSMQGEPIAQVVDACQRLVDVLAPTDSLGVVAFSDGARTVVPVQPLGDEARREARRAIATVAAGGSTNLSGGLAHGALALGPRKPGERQLLVIMSDGQPNIGATTPATLADETRRIKAREVAVSALGFGAAHNEDVLIAIADAGGGRYAFVDDPKLGAPAFARALGAQLDVVAEDVRLVLTPPEGVEIARVLGDPPTSFGAGGLRVTLQDLIAGDELNVVVELVVRAPREAGPWRPLKLAVEGKVAGTTERFTAKGEVAVTLTRGPREPQSEVALAAVAIACADEMRGEARKHADRHNFAAAAAVLKKAKQMIEGTPGYTPGQGALGDAVDTLTDEIAAMEQHPDPEKYQAFRRAARDYANFGTGTVRAAAGTGLTRQTVSAQELVARLAQGQLPEAWLVMLAGPTPGARFPLSVENDLGRGAGVAVQVESAMVSRRHTRIVFTGGAFHVVDLGSSNGTMVNGKRVGSHALVAGDVITVGDVQLRFETK